MSGVKLTKANIKFLEDVQHGRVRRVAGYTKRRGRYERFIGGEVRARKLALDGLINLPKTPDLGRPSYATLTPAGRLALSTKTEGGE